MEAVREAMVGVEMAAVRVEAEMAEGWAVEVMEVVTVEAKVAKMAVVMAAAAMEAAVKVLDLEARAAEGGRALAR